MASLPGHRQALLFQGVGSVEWRSFNPVSVLVVRSKEPGPPNQGGEKPRVLVDTCRFLTVGS